MDDNGTQAAEQRLTFTIREKQMTEEITKRITGVIVRDKIEMTRKDILSLSQDNVRQVLENMGFTYKSISEFPYPISSVHSDILLGYIRILLYRMDGVTNPTWEVLTYPALVKIEWDGNIYKETWRRNAPVKSLYQSNPNFIYDGNQDSL